MNLTLPAWQLGAALDHWHAVTSVVLLALYLELPHTSNNAICQPNQIYLRKTFASFIPVF